MKPNIGTINSMVRITAGLSMLTILTIRAGKGAPIHPMLVVLSAMKVAEGIVHYCPLTAAFDEMGTEKDGIEQGWQQQIGKPQQRAF